MDDTCAKPRIMPATATIGSRLSFRRTAAQITPVAPSVTSDQERPTASRREETRRSSGDGAENDGADGMKQRHRKDDSKWRKEEERKRGREIEHTSRSKELASFGSSSRKNAETEARAGVDREDHGTGTIGCAESGEARGEPAGRLRHSQPAERASDNASPLGSICEGRQSYTAAEHSTSSGLTPRRRGREGEPAKGSIEHTVAGAAPPAGDTEPPGSPPSSAKSSAVSDEQKHIPSDQQCQSLNSADSRYDARASSPGGRNDCVEDSTSNGTFAVDGAVSDETSLDVTTFAGTKSADRDAENSVTTAAKAGRGATPASKEVALKVPEPECLIRERNGPIHASVGFFDIRSLDPNLVPRLPLARQRRVWYPDRLRHHRGLTHGRQVGLASMTFSRNAESHRLERAGPSRRVPAVAGADHFAPTSPLVFERQIGQLSCDIEDPAGLQKNRRVFLRESPLGQRNMPISVAAAQESQYGRHDMWQVSGAVSNRATVRTPAQLCGSSLRHVQVRSPCVQEAASTMWQRRQGLANDRIRSKQLRSTPEPAVPCVLWQGKRSCKSASIDLLKGWWRFLACLQVGKPRASGHMICSNRSPWSRRRIEDVSTST